jgi:hypothetical protein
LNEYEDMKNLLLQHFTSEDNEYRLLFDWQKTGFSQFVRRYTQESQRAVFEKLVKYLKTCQRQMNTIYHCDHILRDQLLIAIDVPEINRSLRERVPKTSNDLIQRAATSLSIQPVSASALLASSFDVEISTESDASVAGDYYVTGRRFGGAARKLRKPKKSSRVGSKDRRCWVCEGPHLAKEKHSNDEIRKALERRKQDNAFLSVFNVSDTIEESLSSHSSNESPAENSGAATVDVACFASILDENLVENLKAVERCGDAAFICGYQQRHQRELESMYTALAATDDYPTFRGLILDTGANRKSIMLLELYRSYCHAFGVPVEIRPVTGRVGGIASSITVCGVATIPVPFLELNIVCDFELYLFNGDGPNLLSKLDMKNAGFELLALQDDLLWLGGRAQHLHSINEFMVHKWEPGDLASTLFTDAELLKLHRSFGHPSVEKLSNLLERARPDEMDASVRKVLQEIVAHCQTCIEHSSPRRRFNRQIYKL